MFLWKKTLIMLWVGVQSSEDRKDIFFFCRTFFSQKTFLSEKTFEKFVIKDQRGPKKWWEYLKLVFRKQFQWKDSLTIKFFWRTLLSVGVQRTHHWKKIILCRKYFFHWFLFPSNKIDSFGIFDQWSTQNWCYKQK